jgi:hypothetical protein
LAHDHPHRLYCFPAPISRFSHPPLGKQTRKLSFGRFSLELAEVSEMKPRSLDAEIRELEAGARPQSGPLDLLAQMREQATNDYIVIDLGSESAPRWLSSRLYLFANLLSPVAG